MEKKHHPKNFFFHFFFSKMGKILFSKMHFRFHFFAKWSQTSPNIVLEWALAIFIGKNPTGLVRSPPPRNHEYYRTLDFASAARSLIFILVIYSARDFGFFLKIDRNMHLGSDLRPGFRLCLAHFYVDIAISERFLRGFFNFEKFKKIDFSHIRSTVERNGWRRNSTACPWVSVNSCCKIDATFWEIVAPPLEIATPRHKIKKSQIVDVKNRTRFSAKVFKFPREF